MVRKVHVVGTGMRRPNIYRNLICNLVQGSWRGPLLPLATLKDPKQPPNSPQITPITFNQLPFKMTRVLLTGKSQDFPSFTPNRRCY